MKRFIKKSAFILCGLLLSIIIIGQVFPQNESTVTAPVVAEKVLVPGGQSVGVAKVSTGNVRTCFKRSLLNQDMNNLCKVSIATHSGLVPSG